MSEILNYLKQQGITPRTAKLLMLIWPHPFGQAMKIKEAAKELHISPQTAYERLKRLKKSCPVAYAKFRRDRKEQSVIGQFLHWQAITNNNKTLKLPKSYKNALRDHLDIESIGSDEVTQEELDDILKHCKNMRDDYE